MESEIKDGLLSGYLRQARLKRAARYVTGNSVLDIGCDRGYMIPYLPESMTYYGVDANAAMLDAARRRYPQHSFQQLLLDSASLGQLPSQRFDTIILIAVAEHLDDPMHVLRALTEKLTPRGRLIITSPHKRSHQLLVAMARLGLARNDKHEHEQYIDHAMILELSGQLSLELIVCERFQLGLNRLWVLEKRGD